MILKVYCVLQIFLIQVISAQLSLRDLSTHNALNNLANLPLAGYGRSRRQVNPPVSVPSNGNLPVNNFANGLPFGNGISFGNFPRGNGLPNSLAFNNGLLNNLALNNGMAMPNNLPLNVPFSNINNVPQNRLLPSINGLNNNGLTFNNVPNGLPNINNLPVANKFPYFNNVPVANNNLNLNNLLNANPLPNMNGLPSLNNLPCGSALPQINGQPPNNLPSGNILPSINNRLPNINNFRITEIGIGNGGGGDITRFSRYNLQDGNIPNANNLQNSNGLAEISHELANINNNGFSSMTNSPPASALPNNMPVHDRFSIINHFMYHNGVPNIASEPQNINNLQLSSVLPDVSNFQNFNVMPVNQQRFVNNVPLYDNFAVPNNFPVNTAVPTNNRLVNTNNIGMPFFNGGNLNDVTLANNGMAVNMPDTYLQINDGHEFPTNNFQFGNIQVPVNNWHYDFVGANMPMPGIQNTPEGVQLFSNGPNDYQTALTSNNFNLAQELVKNLQIEGNMPFLNGLPVAGITETVTVLNGLNK